MERLTTRHCGVAVIKDKSKFKEAMEKLAAYEEAEEQKLKYKPGEMVWCIEEIGFGNEVEISGYLFMAMCGEFVITCAEDSIYENNFEEQLKAMQFESSDFDGVSVNIHHKENVFNDIKEAEQAAAEME